MGRNFALLFSARSISYFGTYLAPIAVAFAVLELTGSATDTGIAFACCSFAGSTSSGTSPLDAGE